MLKDAIHFLQDAVPQVVAEADSFLRLADDANIQILKYPLRLPGHLHRLINRRHEVLLLETQNECRAEHDQ